MFVSISLNLTSVFLKSLIVLRIQVDLHRGKRDLCINMLNLLSVSITFLCVKKTFSLLMSIVYHIYLISINLYISIKCCFCFKCPYCICLFFLSLYLPFSADKFLYFYAKATSLNKSLAYVLCTYSSFLCRSYVLWRNGGLDMLFLY